MVKTYSYGILNGIHRYGRVPTQKTTLHNRPKGQSVLEISVDGFPIDHPFLVERTKKSGSSATGRKDSSGWINEWSECPSSMWLLQKSASVATPNNGALAAQLLAGTNPTRANVLLPVFVFELRELPMMLKDAGSLLLGTMSKRVRDSRKPKNLAASQYLAYNFGWAPLISDVKKLFSFKEQVTKRAREFDRLGSAGGLKRRYKLGTDENSGSYDVNCYYSTGLQTMPCSYTTTQKSWGTVRWRPAGGAWNDKVRRPTPPEIRRIILGLNGANVTANIWEAVPWSWLIDWFVNVDDMIGANQGRGLVTPGNVNIMTHKVTRGHHASQTISFAPNGEVTWSDGHYLLERKARTQSNATLTANVPLLSGHQLSILGSLALLRGR